MALSELLADVEKPWCNIRLNDLTVDNTISAGAVAFASIETPVLIVDAPSAAAGSLLTCQDDSGTCAWQNTANLSTITTGSLVVTNDGPNSVQIVGDIDPAIANHSNLGSTALPFSSITSTDIAVVNSLVPTAAGINAATVGTNAAPFLSVNADQGLFGFVETSGVQVDAGGTGITCSSTLAMGGDIYPMSDEAYDIGRSPFATFRNLNLSGVATASAAYLNGTSNQIKVQPNGVGNSLIITTGTPSFSNATLTIPDITAGSSAGEFVVTQGAGQTIAQPMMLSSPLTFGAMKLFSVQRVLQLADIYALSTVGSQTLLVGAAGPGTIVVPTLLAFNSVQPTGTTVAFSGGSSLIAQYGPQAAAGTGPSAMTTSIPASLFTGGTNVYTMHTQSVVTPVTSTIMNQSVYVCCVTAYTGGTGTTTNGSMVITVQYLIVAAF